MTHEIPAASFNAWLDEHMLQGQRNIPARLLTLVGLLERLRETPRLEIETHRAPSGAQLIEHNSFVEAALTRFDLKSPVQEFGRRANNLGAWAPALFSWLRQHEFDTLDNSTRGEFLTALQTLVSERLVTINQDKPLVARFNKGTCVAVIADLLDQAQIKKRAKDVAEYLVGAKLELRLGRGVVLPKNVNVPSGGKLADFRVGNTAIEVTTVATPDRSHLDQVSSILANTGLQVWLLTRLKDREKWQNVARTVFGAQVTRVVVADIETFVGQNVTEIGRFEAETTKAALAALFKRYEEAWLPSAGAAGIRIADPEAL